jgi:Fe-S-cluster containining protein
VAAQVEVVETPQLVAAETVVTTRCTGHCCRCFTLPVSPVEIGQRLLKARRGEPTTLDIETIAAMLIYKGGHYRNPEARGSFDDEPGYRLVHFYGCKHLTVAGDCGIYDRRPHFCRSFPEPHQRNETGHCEFKGCTRRVITVESTISVGEGSA